MERDTMKAIQFDRVGGPEVLTLVDVEEPDLPDDGLLVDVRAVGVNFADTYARRGSWPTALPSIPGDEAVGVVRAVGARTEGFAPGDRVAWTMGRATYAEVAVAPARTAAKLPDGLPDEAGLAIAQGLTAHYLASDTARLVPGDVALVLSGAGGVGGLLTQLLTLKGVRVIATVSSEAKVAAARAAGAEAVLVARDGGFSGEVRALTGGAGAAAVFDAVGKDSFEASLASVARRGTVVLYGASSGQPPLLDTQALARAGSASLTRVRLWDFIVTREAFEARAADLFGWIADGRVTVNIGGRYPLSQAAEAQAALESRATTGKLLLVTETG
jgi:NADPH2:quinone reductase